MKKLPIILVLALCGSGCDSIEKAKEFAKNAAEAAKTNAGEGSVWADGGVVHRLTAEDFESFTQQTGTLVVVDFYADWCGPCKRLAPMLDKLAAEFGDRVVVGKLDIDAHGEVSKKMGVRGIPDLRFYRDGKQVDKIVGLPPERELRSRFELHTKDVAVRKKKGSDTNPDPEKTKESAMQPMGKDWMPPGMEKR